jgi:hypothetical protein
MEFFIKKNATLPLLKLQVVKDGRSDYNRFMELIEESSIFFSMVDVSTGIPKITTKPAGFVDKVQLDPNAETEYYIYYQFASFDTNREGRYEAQFLFRNSEGTLVLPIREKLFINVQESFIADDLQYDGCYVLEYPCCGTVCTTTTTPPCPSCPCGPSITPTPTPTTTSNSFCVTSKRRSKLRILYGSDVWIPDTHTNDKSYTYSNTYTKYSLL